MNECSVDQLNSCLKTKNTNKLYTSINTYTGLIRPIQECDRIYFSTPASFSSAQIDYLILSFSSIDIDIDIFMYKEIK